MSRDDSLEVPHDELGEYLYELLKEEFGWNLNELHRDELSSLSLPKIWLSSGEELYDILKDELDWPLSEKHKEDLMDFRIDDHFVIVFVGENHKMSGSVEVAVRAKEEIDFSGKEEDYHLKKGDIATVDRAVATVLINRGKVEKIEEEVEEKEEEELTKEQLDNILSDYETDFDLAREEIWTRKDDDREMVAIHMGTHKKGETERDYKPIAWYDYENQICYKSVKANHYVKGGNTVDGRFVGDAISLPYDMVRWLAQFGDVDIVIRLEERATRERVEGQPVLKKGTKLKARLSDFVERAPAQLSKHYEHQFFLEIDEFEIEEPPQRTLTEYSEVDDRWMKTEGENI